MPPSTAPTPRLLGSPKRDGDEWCWEATCLGSFVVWMPAPTQAEAESAAIEFVREHAKSVRESADAVLDEVGGEV